MISRTSGLCWREEKVDQYVHAGLSFYDNNSQIPVLQCTICKLMLIVRNIPSDADIMIEHAVHQPGCPFIVRYKGPYFASVHVAFRNLDLWKKGENFLHVHVPNMREALQGLFKSPLFKEGKYCFSACALFAITKSYRL